MSEIPAILHRLSQAREKLGYSQEYVGRVIKANHATVSRIEMGKCPLTMTRLFKLAALYRVSILWVLTGAIYRRRSKSYMRKHILRWDYRVRCLRADDYENIRMWSQLGFTKKEICDAYFIRPEYVEQIVNEKSLRPILHRRKLNENVYFTPRSSEFIPNEQ